MAQPWLSDPIVGQAPAATQAPAPAAPRGIPGTGPKPTPAPTTYRTLTRDEVATRGLNPARAYQESSEGKVDDLGELPESALPAADRDPERGTQIRTILDNLKTLRGLSDDTLAVGSVSGYVSGWPVVGQNRANVEGALQMVQGDLVQQQIARLNAAAGGKGVASLANSETEAARMAASIANLDPNQDLTNFTTGLDRAEQYYIRALAREMGVDPNDPAFLRELGREPTAGNRDDAAAGFVPTGPAGPGGGAGSAPPPIPGVREPTTQDEFRNGIQWNIDAPETSWSDARSAYLASMGIGESDEQKITGFWNANSGNGGLTPDGVRQWYERNGFAVPAEADVARGIENARAGHTFGGIDDTAAKDAYEAKLNALISDRGRDPTGTIETIGTAGAQGLMLGQSDEFTGLQGAINAIGDGGNPVAAYQVERDMERLALEQSREANPGTALASEITGSIPGGGIGFGKAIRLGDLAAKSARMGNTARAGSLARLAVGEAGRGGAITGAAYGFGTGEGLQDSITSAAIGAPLGAVAGAAVQKAAPTIGRAVGSLKDLLPSAGRGAAERAERMAAADELGITMMPADVGGVGTRMASGFVGRTLGGIPMAEGAQVARNTAGKARSRIAENVGDVVDDVGAGQAAKRGFKGFERDSERRGRDLYEQIPVPDDAVAASTATKGALQEITRGMESNRALSRIWTGHPRLKATLDALTPAETQATRQQELAAVTSKVDEARAALASAQQRYDALRGQIGLSGVRMPQFGEGEIRGAGEAVTAAQRGLTAAETALGKVTARHAEPLQDGSVSWADMKRLRTIVGEMVGDPSLTSDGNAKAALRRFYGALTQDMEATATSTSPRALSEWRRANQYWRGRESRIEGVFSTLLGKDGDRAPEAVFRQIESWAKERTGDVGRLAQTMRSLPEDEANTIRATLIDRMGQAKPGGQTGDNEVFSPGAWATQWHGMSGRAKAVLFPNAQHRADLDKFAKVMDGMRTADEFTNWSNTGLVASGLATTSLALASLPAAIVAGATQYGAGKLLASPRFARWLAGAPRTTDRRVANAYIGKLDGLAARSPEMGAEIIQLRDYLQQSLAQSPSRAAASEQEQN
jgi:hypothetical protein